VAFADDLVAASDTQDVFLLGDFNAYTQENPMQVFYDAGYTNLNEAFAGEQTYVFDGKVGSLDHVLASSSVLDDDLIRGVDVWNVNSVESVLFEYSRYNYFASELFDGNSVFRASDHDPILVGIGPGDGTDEPDEPGDGDESGEAEQPNDPEEPGDDHADDRADDDNAAGAGDGGADQPGTGDDAGAALPDTGAPAGGLTLLAAAALLIGAGLALRHVRRVVGVSV